MYLAENDAERTIRRIVAEVVDGESPCIARVFDCPVCNHQTLSETRYTKTETNPRQTIRYCFGCGNTFSKIVSWEKRKGGKV